jgi:fructokinase
VTTRFDVTAFGELVIDLIPAGHDGDEPLFAARPGGAPGNVAAGIARLGLRSAMLSKVGREPFGDLVVRALSSCGVETAASCRGVTETTALAAVSVDAKGERNFTLYRTGCADASYSCEEVDTDIVRRSRLLHVGSLSLGTPVSAAAQRFAIAKAREAGALVSADPNLRPAVWRDPEAMLIAGREAVASADIVKLSGEELAILSGTDKVSEAVRRLWHADLKIMAVTKGPLGADLYMDDGTVSVDGFAVDVVDTVGCGDAFMAALLAGLLGLDLSRLDRNTIATIGRRACAAGAIVATKAGAMTRMPRPEEIDNLIAMRQLEAT